MPRFIDSEMKFDIPNIYIDVIVIFLCVHEYVFKRYINVTFVMELITML